MSHFVRRFYCGFAAAALAIGLVGCQNSDPSAQESMSGFQISEPEKRITELSMEKYAENLAENRTAISGYETQYQEEMKAIKESRYDNFHYENCRFAEFPDIDELEVLECQDHGITVQESWDTIEQWLESIGKLDKIDMKKEVRVVSEQLGTDENDEYFLFYDHMSELDSGKGAFINNNLCHMQIVDGIYSMSDGKITEYLGYSTKADDDALGVNEQEVIESGTYTEMENKTYELIDGTMSVQECAQLVKDFFLAGTPFPCADGITVDIPEVRVFRLGDVYGYDFMVRRVYNQVPFAYMDYGAYQFDGTYFPDGDIKHAYVADSSGVTAFAGYNESEKLVLLASGDEIIGAEQTVKNLSEDFASSVNVHVESMGLTYFPVQFSYFKDTDARVVLPCWEIAGTDGSNGKEIRIYCDVFTGEIYYYTFRTEE